MRSRQYIVLTSLAAAVSVTGPGPRGAASHAPSDDSAATATALLRWRELGPAFTGVRINDIAVADLAADHRHGSVVYAATPGGLFRTNDAGISWTPLFDAQPSAAVNRVAVAPSAPAVLWAGTGDIWGVPDLAVPGAGVWKSSDAGGHWASVGLRDAGVIGAIAIDPTNADVVYVAALGLRDQVAERGVYKTTDGGRTWVHVLPLPLGVGAIDLALDPHDARVLYAAAWEQHATPVGYIDHGTGSGIYRSRDGGQTWTRLGQGLPAGPVGRIGLSISPAQPRRVYAVLTLQTTVADSVGAAVAKRTNLASRSPFSYYRVYRSDDEGAHWIAGEVRPTWQPTNFSRIVADPQSADRVYLTYMHHTLRSEDGGRRFSPVCASDQDFDGHAVWIDPADNRHVLIGADFGLSRSEDGGVRCRNIESIPGKLVWSVAVDRRRPFYHVYGSFQDIGAYGAPHRTRAPGGIVSADWTNIGGESGGLTADPADTNAVFNGAELTRFDQRRGEVDRVAPGAASVSSAAEGPSNRTRLVVSAFDSHVLYWGGRALFRSSDAGATWRELQMPGDTVAHETPPADASWFAAERTRRLKAVAESPRTPAVLYVGSSRGEVWVSTDTGRTWRRSMRPLGLPANYGAIDIAPSVTAPGTAYVTFNGVAVGHYAPMIFRTTDYGAHWQTVVGDLPHAAAWVVREHPRTPRLLFVGTDVGVFTSIDGGTHWEPLRTGMPAVRVTDLALQPDASDVVAGTWGRGIFVLDDVRALEEIAAGHLSGAAAKAAFLVPIRPTVRFTMVNSRVPDSRTPSWAAPNPPYGAPVTYYLAHNVLPGVRLNVIDSQGIVVRTLPVPATAGWHRITWDLQASLEPARKAEREADTADAETVVVRPGTYRAQLVLPANTFTTEVEIQSDPLVPWQRAQYDSLLAALRYRRRLQVRGDSIRTTALLVQASVDTLCAERQVHAGSPASLHCAQMRQGLLNILQALTNPVSLDNAEGFLTKPKGLLDQLTEVTQWRGDQTSAPTPEQYAALIRIESGMAEQAARLATILHGLPPSRRAASGGGK